MKKVDLMIFDFDGTLVSTSDDLANAINYTLKQLRLPQRSKNEIISFVGDGVESLMDRALGKESIQFHHQALDIFTGYYGEHLLDNTVLCPQVLEVLNNFVNKKKIILTNKRHVFTLATAQGLDIEKYFVEIIGADTTPFQKPDGRIIDYILSKYGTDKDSTLMIGDGMNDISVARNSGILSCAYLSGLGNRDDLIRLKADYYCETLLEINSLFY